MTNIDFVSLFIDTSIKKCMSDIAIRISRPARKEPLDEAEMNIDLNLEEERDVAANTERQKSAISIVTPGELITDDPVWMKGHGVYFLNNETYSSVAGNISRVNRLLSVIPLRGRYEPETGDHVVGRITEVGPKRWKVDIGAKQDAVLMLGSVNLPGGILRRKSESDELQMRSFLKEGDLLNAEVQTVFNQGQASLHTRSLKYGKLRNGVFLRVPASLIIKQKNHSFQMPGNVSMVIGMNGFIWLSKTSEIEKRDGTALARPLSLSSGMQLQKQDTLTITRLEENSSWKIYSDENDENISRTTRDIIARYYNVIRALAANELGIIESRIRMGYEGSMAYSDVGTLADRTIQEGICQDIINTEKMRGMGSTKRD